MDRNKESHLWDYIWRSNFWASSRFNIYLGPQFFGPVGQFGYTIYTLRTFCEKATLFKWDRMNEIKLLRVYSSILFWHLNLYTLLYFIKVKQFLTL